MLLYTSQYSEISNKNIQNLLSLVIMMTKEEKLECSLRVINLMMPYIYDNGYNDDKDVTEEEKYQEEKMKYFACRSRLTHQPCLRFKRKQAAYHSGKFSRGAPHSKTLKYSEN